MISHYQIVQHTSFLCYSALCAVVITSFVSADFVLVFAKLLAAAIVALALAVDVVAAIVALVVAVDVAAAIVALALAVNVVFANQILFQTKKTCLHFSLLR